MGAHPGVEYMYICMEAAILKLVHGCYPGVVHPVYMYALHSSENNGNTINVEIFV